MSSHPVAEMKKSLDKSTNEAFVALREAIPIDAAHRRLTKFEVVQLAGRYIIHLKNTLNFGTDDHPCSQNGAVHVQFATSEADIPGLIRTAICTFCHADARARAAMMAADTAQGMEANTSSNSGGNHQKADLMEVENIPEKNEGF